MTSPASHAPVVLDKTSVPSFVQTVLDLRSGPSTLVVCFSKLAFIEHLRAPDGGHGPATPSPLERDAGEAFPEDPAAQPSRHPARRWSTPTLRLLAASRAVNVVFCPDLTQLRAYLATHSARVCESTQDSDAPGSFLTKPTRVLAILNPVNLHRPTSAFSAQGLNRTFALAVEAAHATASRLIMAECRPALPTPSADDHSDMDDQALIARMSPPGNLWDEDVSILNVTTKSFGPGERGWVGRTVSLRAVAERWCTFATALD